MVRFTLPRLVLAARATEGLTFFVLALPTVANAQGNNYGVLERISVSVEGTDPLGNSGVPSVSSDGRFVAYFSESENIVPNDVNTRRDVFVRDRFTSHNLIASVSSLGVLGNGDSQFPSLSGDGRFVAFESFATNLVPNDTNGKRDIFVYDFLTGATERISKGLLTESNGSSFAASISVTGRYVVFLSDATNLVNGDTNGLVDIFKYDRQTQTTTRVNVSSGGVEANGLSVNPSITSDGRYVAFQSAATNLVVNDTNGVEDVFVRDTVANLTARVSTGAGGAQLDAASTGPRMTSDGRYIVFACGASGLEGANVSGAENIYVLDQNSGTINVASVGLGGNVPDAKCYTPDISLNGRFVTYSSFATNLVDGDDNSREDVFVYDRDLDKTWRVSVSNTGQQIEGFSSSAVISDDGKLVAFMSDANYLVPDDGNESTDVFAFDFTNGNPPPPVPFVTIDMIPLAGRIATTKKFGNGNFRVAGVYTLNSKSVDGEIHPDTEGLQLSIGEPNDPLVYVVNANDPAWKFSKAGVWTWKSSKGVFPIVNIRLDTKKHRYVFRGAKFGLLPQATPEVEVRTKIGNDLALDKKMWKASKIVGILTYVGKLPK